MKVMLEAGLIKQLLVTEDFFNKVPEYFYLKEAGSRINQAMSQEGGCSACTENNLINPTVMNFMSHAVNMYLDCGPDALTKFKKYVQALYNEDDTFQIGMFYKENDEAEVVELIV